MESPLERGNRRNNPATQGGGNQPDPNIPATMAATYPSPAPSCLPSFSAPKIAPQVSEAQNPKETPHGAAKNAKEFYKQLYTIADHRKRSSNKRKKHCNIDEGGRDKKRQAVDNICNEGTSAAGAGLTDLGKQESFLRDRDEHEHMQLLKRDTDPNDAQASHDLTQLYGSMISFGYGKCKLVDHQKWELDGFGTTLYHHQVIGVSWMLGRELYPSGPKGGILADEMGLGKTVQLLACMSQNLPKKRSNARKTLVVAPKRLLLQWFNEIQSHWPKNKEIRASIYAAGSLMTDAQWEKDDIM